MTWKQRLGLYLQDMHVRDMVYFSQFAEAHGFESVWVAESRLARDALTPVTAIATVTSTLRVGAGVINTWTRNAALIAQTFATLDELSGGRVMLGLGAWWDPLAWKVGIERRDPLRCMREYVEVIKRLFRMETVEYEGEFVKMRGVRLDVLHGAGERPRNIPIYVGATGFKMMELAGEIADGVLLNYLVSPIYNDKALQHIRAGAGRAGRRIEDIDRPQLIACSMDDDPDRAVKLAKKHVTMTLGQQPHIMKASGVSPDLIEEVQRVMGGWPARPGGIEKASEIVPDSVVKMITASGTARDVVGKVEEYVVHGCTAPLLLPLSGNVEYVVRKLAEV